ncbi:MAG: hypothetical protein LBT47_00290 [Deltaproteobacteria bacterium]|nr:hypothetical protein [Deltaproteobacteria bacterium]
MVATLAFATGIAELYGSNRGQLGLGYLVKKCILPVCLIFLAYPGGFFAYIGMLAIASAIFGFFQVAPGAKASDRMRWARLGVISVVVACLVSFVLAPFGAFHLFKRSMETANQTVGWLLPLINPWLLSGLPVYLSDFFTSSKEGGQPLVYLPFVVVVLGLAFGSARAFGRQAQGAVVWGRSSSPERAGLIWAISLTFLVSLIIYLLVYMFIGNRYQTWKFASFVVLPLSFVPLALFITVFRFYWKKWIKIVLLIPALLIVIFIGYHFSLILPLKQIPGKVYGTVSAETYINVLSSIFKNVKPGSAVILYLQDDSNLMLAARYFYNNPPYKVKLVKAHWLYTNFMHADFSKFINSTDNYIVISDRSFAGLFNSSSLERHSSELYVYEPLWFKEHGYVVILGVNIHEKWKLATKWVTVKVGLPEKLIGRPVKLALALTPADNDLATGQADLVIHGSQESYPNQAVPGLVEGTIGAELTNSGMFIATVKFDENDFSAAWGGKGPNLIFDKVTVEAAN